MHDCGSAMLGRLLVVNPLQGSGDIVYSSLYVHTVYDATCVNVLAWQYLATLGTLVDWFDA